MAGKPTVWTFEKVFYGTKGPLNLKQVRAYLTHGYCLIPHTLFEGYYKAVCRTGNHDDLYRQIQRPFPDGLIAQKPEGKFALHFSGGYDSSILAKLYDRPDADYIHFTGPESEKARALAATLEGTLHEIQVTPADFIETADALVGRLSEPYAFEDIVFAYIASKKAKELGHTLIVAGDGGDGVLGGYDTGPYSRKSVVVWKTIEPNQLLGLQTLQPYMHSGPYAWSKASLDPKDVARDKRFARDFCRELGMPEVVIEGRKVPWAGSIGMRDNDEITAHLRSTVQNSGHQWVTEFEFSAPPRPGLLFRQYSLVKWLEVNYKAKLDSDEARALSDNIRLLNAIDAQRAQHERTEGRLRYLFPSFALHAARRLQRLISAG